MRALALTLLFAVPALAHEWPGLAGPAAPTDAWYPDTTALHTMEWEYPYLADLKGQNVVVVFVQRGSLANQGVDCTMADSPTVMWSNPGEVGGTADFDDDGNGCVDDINGCDFRETPPEETAGVCAGSHEGDALKRIFAEEGGTDWIGRAPEAELFSVVYTSDFAPADPNAVGTYLQAVVTANPGKKWIIVGYQQTPAIGMTATHPRRRTEARST
jgi:hypothetical protein